MLSRTNTWAMDTKYRYSSDPIGPHGSHSFANHRNRHSLLTTSTYLAAYTSSHLSYKCTLKNNHVELPQLVCLLPWDLLLDLSCPAHSSSRHARPRQLRLKGPRMSEIHREWQPAIGYEHLFPGAPTQSDPPEHVYCDCDKRRRPHACSPIPLIVLPFDNRRPPIHSPLLFADMRNTWRLTLCLFD